MIAGLLQVLGFLGVIAGGAAFYITCGGDDGFGEFLRGASRGLEHEDSRLAALTVLASVIMLVAGIVQSRRDAAAKAPPPSSPKVSG